MPRLVACLALALAVTVGAIPVEIGAPEQAIAQDLQGPYGQKRYQLPGDSRDPVPAPQAPVPPVQATPPTLGFGSGYDTGQSGQQGGGFGGGLTGGGQSGGQVGFPQLRIDVPNAVNAPPRGINFVVFFPPYSAALDAAAQETVLVTAELAGELPGTPVEILLNPANQDDSKGTATLRGEAIRQALVRFGLPTSRIRVRRDLAGTIFANQPRGALNEVGEFVEVIIRTE